MRNAPQLHAARLLLPLICLALLSACATTTVKRTAPQPLVVNNSLPEPGSALDVGIGVFDPGLDEVDDKDMAVFPDVRVAEARYLPNLLMETMQRSGYWGAVRVMPEDLLNTDIRVRGTILVSTGESLKLRVRVDDASGKHWFTRNYENVASKYAYSRTINPEREPFQDVYNQISNDIAAYRQAMPAQQAKRLRMISELRFAEDFAPDAFGGYLTSNDKGVYQVTRLPADNDPMMTRIREIRERDYLFIDTLQDYYLAFGSEMEIPYDEWREQTYQEIVSYNELRAQATRHRIAGIVAIIGGIVAAGSDSRSTRMGGNVAIYGGAELIKDSIGKKAESQIHLEAMDELGDSLSVELSTSVIELDDRTYTLQGDVTSQYVQWKDILREIYRAETGLSAIEQDAANSPDFSDQ